IKCLPCRCRSAASMIGPETMEPVDASSFFRWFSSRILVDPGRRLRRRTAIPPLVPLIVLACLSTAGCRLSKPDIVLVTLEGVRDSDLQRPGALMAVRTLRDQRWHPSCAITPSPDAAAAAGSLLTGLAPSTNGLPDASLGRLDPTARVVSEQLRAAGYRTAAF